MIKLVRNAVKITNENIILAIPLVIFMWIVGIYIGYSKSSAVSLPAMLLTALTTLFMLGAFLAGWFYMVKESIVLSDKEFILDKDKAKANINLFREIPTGIGKYFLSFIGMLMIFVVLISLLATVGYKLGVHLFGNLELTQFQIKQLLGTPEDLRMFVESLSENQLLLLFSWNMMFMFGSAIISYFTLLWIPQIIYGCKNPVLALCKSVKKVLKHPFECFKVFLFIGVSNFLLSIISSFAMYNPITYFLIMIFYFYFLVLVIVLIFSYYHIRYELKEDNSLLLTDENSQPISNEENNDDNKQE